jgi:hypothetical protein
MGFWKNLHKGVTTSDHSGASSIARVSYFAEPPESFTGADWSVTGLPKGLVEKADQEMELDGELISFVRTLKDAIPIQKVARIGRSSDQAAFFAQQSRSELWRVHFGTGASGARYSILVERDVRPARAPRCDESKRVIYEEFEQIMDRAMIDLLCSGQKEETKVANAAMSSASSDVMWKHGISNREMTDIIAEGLTKWSKRGQKGD